MKCLLFIVCVKILNIHKLTIILRRHMNVSYLRVKWIQFNSSDLLLRFSCDDKYVTRSSRRCPKPRIPSSPHSCHCHRRDCQHTLSHYHSPRRSCHTAPLKYSRSPHCSRPCTEPRSNRWWWGPRSASCDSCWSRTRETPSSQSQSRSLRPTDHRASWESSRTPGPLLRDSPKASGLVYLERSTQIKLKKTCPGGTSHTT